MIANNFIYCRPESEDEAVKIFNRFDAEGKTPVYYGGGSEIITMCTAESISPPAVIDIKNLPSLRRMGENEGVITFGACKTLEEIRMSRLFPLLGETGGRIADHTNQCRITLGGNLCSAIIYRETALPLLIADARLELFGPDGRRYVSVHDVFDGRMRLFSGEFIVSVQADKYITEMPYAHIKRTFSEKIGYPAVTAAAIQADGNIRIAFSGICDYPFRCTKIEHVINNKQISPKTRAEAVTALLPQPPQSDCEGSGAYRLELFKLTVEEIIDVFER